MNLKRTTKLGRTLAVAVGGLLLAGCESLNYSQYQILGPVDPFGVRAAIPPADREAVKQIVGAVAARFKLVDMTASSLVPNILAYYTEIDVANPLEIKVYLTADKVVVDLMQTSAGGETATYRELKQALVRDLAEKFGDRVQITPAAQLTGSKKLGPGTPKKVVTPRAKG